MIHRLRCSHCGEQISVKVIASAGSGRTPHADAQKEYETIVTLQSVYPRDGRYETLTPLGCVELEGGATGLITRFVPGGDMSRHSNSPGGVKLQEACRSAGEWLRRLHASGAASSAIGELHVHDRLSYLTEAYASALMAQRVTRNAFQVLDETSTSVSTVRVPSVRLHGDFKLNNLLFNEAMCIGLDIQWRCWGPAVYDLASFIDHLWMDNGAWHRSCVTQLGAAEDRFLAGYGYDGDTRALRWVQLYFALCYMGSYRSRGHLRSVYAKFVILPLVRRLSEQLRNGCS